MHLDATTKSLEGVLASAPATTNPTFDVAYNDHTTSSLTLGDASGAFNGTTDVVLVNAPAASTQRQIVRIAIANVDTIPHFVTLFKDVSGTEYTIIRVWIKPGEELNWTREASWRIIDSEGRFEGDILDVVRDPPRQRHAFHKVGSAPDTVGYWYCFAKDNMFPPAWAPGTPGLNGRNTDGTTTTDAGCFPITNPAAGNNYLTRFACGATLAELVMLFDVLWVNSGIVVTTTTAQAIASGTLPARDINGSTNGEGLMIGLLTTTANTNAAAIANSTVNYTNSDGTAGRTATLAALVGAQIPATPAIGTIVWFLLQAGDKGVRSIEGITLGTSLAAGAVSLLIARPLALVPCLAQVPAEEPFPIDPGIKLFDGTCALLCIQASSTTAATIYGTLEITEK